MAVWLPIPWAYAILAAHRHAYASAFFQKAVSTVSDMSRAIYCHITVYPEHVDFWVEHDPISAAYVVAESNNAIISGGFFSSGSSFRSSIRCSNNIVDSATNEDLKRLFTIHFHFFDC